MKPRTEFGKFLRMQQVEHDETLKDLSKVLCISSAFISAVMKGERNVPEYWYDMLAEHYEMSEEDKQLMIAAANISRRKIEIDMRGESYIKRSLAYEFSKQFPDMDDERAIMIAKYLYFNEVDERIKCEKENTDEQTEGEINNAV